MGNFSEENLLENRRVGRFLSFTVTIEASCFFEMTPCRIVNFFFFFEFKVNQPIMSERVDGSIKKLLTEPRVVSQSSQVSSSRWTSAYLEIQALESACGLQCVFIHFGSMFVSTFLLLSEHG